MIESEDGAAPNSARPFPGAALPPIAGAWNQTDLQRIWLSTQRQAWRTLAVVPADARISSYEVASLIAALGHHHGESVGLADLRDIQLNRVEAFLDAARELVDRGQRVVIVTRSITENLATIPLARAAEGVILCVSIGSTFLGAIKDAIEQIGKERFLGSMIVHEAPRGAPSHRAGSGLKRLQAGS